ARANRGAHRPFADRGAIVTHVAFHHEFKIDLHLRHAEGTGQHAIVAGDTARLTGRLHHTVARPLDGIGRTDLRAGRRVTMHAHDRHRLWSVAAIHILEVDH